MQMRDIGFGYSHVMPVQFGRIGEREGEGVRQEIPGREEGGGRGTEKKKC